MLRRALFIGVYLVVTVPPAVLGSISFAAEPSQQISAEEWAARIQATAQELVAQRDAAQARAANLAGDNAACVLENQRLKAEKSKDAEKPKG